MNDNQTQYTKNYMLEFKRAIQLVFDNSKIINREVISLDKAFGRILSQAVKAPANVPSFDNSAMDGYAINAADVLNAAKDSPVTLQLAGLSAAGDSTQQIEKTNGKAWKIMTGAPVPEGFDSIIPVEDTQLESAQVICYSSVTEGSHIRKSGEDFLCDEVIAYPGERINANTIMAFSALGIHQVEVFKLIEIAVFSTGKELVDNPEVPLMPGQIRNSNKPFIQKWLHDLPVKIIDAGTNHDEVEKFILDLKQQLENNVSIIISSGAVSMGDFDFIPQAIMKLGGEIIFHKAKIRPGKPILFARFPNGSLYFGLPGNPISAAIGLRFFVATCIRAQLGLEVEKPLVAISQNTFQKKQGFRSILKAKAAIDHKAQLSAEILDGQESFKIKPLLKANGWLLIEEDKEQLYPGEFIEFYPSAINLDEN